MLSTRSATIAGLDRALAVPEPAVLRALSLAWCPDLAAEMILVGAIRDRFAGLDQEALADGFGRALAAGEGDPPDLRALGRTLAGLVRGAVAAGNPGLGPREIDRALEGASTAEMILAAGEVLILLRAWSDEVRRTIDAGTHLVNLLGAAAGPRRVTTPGVR